MRIHPWQFSAFAGACAGLVLYATGLGISVSTILIILLILGFGVGAFLARGAGEETAVDIVPDSPLPVGFGRILLQQMPAPLILISSSGRLTYANPAATRLLTIPELGCHISTVIRAPAFLEPLEDILVDGKDIDFSFSLIGDSERHLEARASVLPEGTSDFGDEAQVIVQIEDRTLDKVSLQTRSDFIANASHELRTPLASILGYIETLQGHAKDDPEIREKFLGIVMQQATRMQRLVDDLMSLSRIEMNAHVPPTDVLGLHRVLVDAASTMFPLATRSDVILQVDIPCDEDGPMVLGDRDQIAQVLVNLIDNAIKYGGSGETVRIAAAKDDPRYPGHVGVSVIDNGPGIPRDAIHRLTERFFRVNDSLSKEKGGTGLGLAITKHILMRHAGALDIQSTQGEGSVFTLWLPVCEYDKESQSAELPI